MKSSTCLISVCIPVFQTECYLAQCLRSVYVQDFSSFEIVVVNDASDGHDEKNHTAKKIVKIAQKECNKFRRQNKLSPVKINYIEHNENRGCVETRRTLVYEARGAYITMADSDDELVENALSAMYKAAIDNDADIVHGTAISGVYDQNGLFHQSAETKCGRIFYGKKEGFDIVQEWFSGLFRGTLWGKLIPHKVYEKAFCQIPYTECNMADDLLIFFFIAINASRYIGIENKVYRYRENSGMSSNRTIDTLQKWRLMCSSSSVFTIITEWISQSADETFKSKFDNEQLSKVMITYLKGNLIRLKESVIPELQPAAYQLLCEYWGEDFVQKVNSIL